MTCAGHTERANKQGVEQVMQNPLRVVIPIPQVATRHGHAHVASLNRSPRKSQLGLSHSSGRHGWSNSFSSQVVQGP